MRVALAIAITAWTLAAWGGRIGLLTSGEGFGAWLRIGGSLIIGLFAAAALTVTPLEPARRPVLIVFSVFTVVLWIRSLIVNWAGDGTLAFKVVHTVLAAGFFALALWAYGFATSETGGSPQPGAVSSSPDSLS
jgi:hypothetical protein